MPLLPRWCPLSLFNGELQFPAGLVSQPCLPHLQLSCRHPPPTGPKELLIRLVEHYYPLPPNPNALEEEAGGQQAQRWCHMHGHCRMHAACCSACAAKPEGRIICLAACLAWQDAVCLCGSALL